MSKCFLFVILSNDVPIQQQLKIAAAAQNIVDAAVDSEHSIY